MKKIEKYTNDYNQYRKILNDNNITRQKLSTIATLYDYNTAVQVKIVRGLSMVRSCAISASKHSAKQREKLRNLDSLPQEEREQILNKHNQTKERAKKNYELRKQDKIYCIKHKLRIQIRKLTQQIEEYKVNNQQVPRALFDELEICKEQLRNAIGMFNKKHETQKLLDITNIPLQDEK